MQSVRIPVFPELEGYIGLSSKSNLVQVNLAFVCVFFHASGSEH